MSFSQATITGVSPPQARNGEIFLAWTSSSPAGTWFQVYASGRLATQTQRRSATLPATMAGHFDVGTVGPGEQYTDFSSSLPSAPKYRLEVEWQGGSFLDPSGNGDVAGFKVFGPALEGDAIDYTSPAAVIPLYSGGSAIDGYGMGGYGAGGYGSAAGWYSWKSDPLWSGTWQVAVASFDREGDLGPPMVGTYTLRVPPREPGWQQPQPRLSYRLLGYGAGGYGSNGYGMPLVSLTWLPSPG